MIISSANRYLDETALRKFSRVFVDYVRKVDEEKKIPVALFVEIQNQPRHYQSFAAASRHMK